MAHELEPAFNPCDDKLPDDEQVFVCRRELLRRNQQFRTVAEKWIVSGSFRKAHALKAEYRHFVRTIPCCAGVVLRPEICDDRWLDYRNPGQYIWAGREIALRQLDEIKALVQEKRTSYEFKPAPAAVAAVA
jgi:hypothetical protein